MEIEVFVDDSYYPCFSIDGTAYHITLGAEAKHVTAEVERKHYYFKTTILPGRPTVIEDDAPRDAQDKRKKAPKFSELPSNVQTFVRQYYDEILKMEQGERKTFTL